MRVALATAEGEREGARVEVSEFKRSGGTVMLKFTIINESEKELSFGHDFTESGTDYGSISGVNLIDTANKRKYFAVLDTEKKCLCSRDIPALKAKSRANLWVQFPEPPPDVQKLNIVVPHFAPMTDVSLAGSAEPST